jgi:hypothetical protein
MAVRNLSAPQTPPRPAPNDQVLILGLNEGATHEAESLRARGNTTTLIQDSMAGSDKVRLFPGTPRATTYDLSTDAGVDTFAASLRLPAAQTTQIADVLKSVGPDARDELGTLASVWAGGEKGGRVPSRLVLSGHSGGDALWGDANGSIEYGAIHRLAEAMPRAAGQVEDVCVAACYAGTADNAEAFKAAFPNMKTFLGYHDSAPGAHSGATAHLARWDRQTRGRADTLDRAPFLPTRKGDHVAIWTEKQGYVDGRPPEPLETARERVALGRPTFERFDAGLETQASPGTGPLRDYYNGLQRLAQHPDLPDAERAGLRREIDATIRLLYYSKTVAPAFQAQRGGEVRAGYAALGMSAPDFGTMSRKDALAAIEHVDAAIAARGSTAPAAALAMQRQLHGLRDLDRAIIPDGWV